MGKRIAACMMLLLMVAACATAWAGYGRELRKATEKGSFYHATNWQAELIWHATFFSDAFRQAFKKKHESLRYLSRPEVDQYVAEQDTRQREGWEFFLSVYTRKPYQHFTNYNDSFWKIYLITESGERVEPVSVDMIPITPYEKKMFRYIDRWSKAYLVVFPKVALGNEFELEMTSVVGSSTLKWDLK